MNKPFVTFLSLILLLLPLGAQAQQQYELRVGNFTRLKVKDHIPVDYKCSPDSSGMAFFTANESDASTIGFTLNGDELSIGFVTDDNRPAVVPRVTVFSDFLTTVVNEGDSTVRVLTVAPSAHFEARQVGNGILSVHDIRAGRVNAKMLTGRGQVLLYGTCNEASYSMIGTGMIQADGLQTPVAKCVCSGTGAIGCYVTDELTVRGLGSTTIYVKGSPKIKNRSVGVKIQPIP